MIKRTAEYIKLAKELGYRVTYSFGDFYATVYADDVIISMYSNITDLVRIYDSDKFKLNYSGKLLDEGNNYEGTEFYDFEEVKVQLMNIAKKIKTLRIEEKIRKIERDFV